MFGKNKALPQVQDSGMHLDVVDIFYTLQGEGNFAGTPAVFIRMYGCNLRCYWCDTDFESGRCTMHVDEIIDKVNFLTPIQIKNDTRPLVVLTGGEPLRQNVAPLVRGLVKQGYRVQIETAGTVMPEELKPVVHNYALYVHLIVSPKTTLLHPFIYNNAIFYKYIVRHGELDPYDGLPMYCTQTEGKQVKLARPNWHKKASMIFLQPCSVQDPMECAKNALVAADSCMQFGYRLSLQQHKIVGLP